MSRSFHMAEAIQHAKERHAPLDDEDYDLPTVDLTLYDNVWAPFSGSQEKPK